MKSNTKHEIKQASIILAEIAEMASQCVPAGRLDMDVQEEYEDRTITGEDVTKEQIYADRKIDLSQNFLDIYERVLTGFEILDITETTEL